MDRSLWLLLRLRGNAWLRFWVRNVRTLKGTLLALVGGLVFLPMLLMALLAPRVQTTAQLDAVRLYGPLALLAYCVLNVMLSSGDRVVYYSPSEVNFLFCGPYRPRQILLYKVTVGIAAGLVTALFMACAFTAHSARFISSYVALFLALELIYLFSMTVGLVISTFGALAFDRGRKLLLAGLCLAAVGAIYPLGRQVLTLPPAELVERAVRSPTVRVLTLPFRPFVDAYASERLWPDLMGWSALALLVDLGLLGLVLTLNAGFLEASAAASTRIYEKIRRARSGSGWTPEASARVKLPMLPWCGGVGPNLWRQLTTATRSPTRLLAMMLFFVVPISVLLLFSSGQTTGSKALVPLVSVFVGISFIASSSVGCDFRPDVGRMEDLKTLPIDAKRIVVGQLLTPVVILCVGQWLSLAMALRLADADSYTIAAVAVLLVPANFLLMAVENLYFLWFPYRTMGITSFDFQAMGRQILLMMAKVVTVGIAAGFAAGLGYVASFVPGSHPVVILAGAWVGAAACGLALVPLVAVAFEQFDVAADRVE